MAEQPSLHVDTDWKKQAQEEKKRLTEEQQKQAADTATAPVGVGVAPGTASGATPAGRERTGATGQLPPPTFGTLVQSFLTQILFYLGDLTPRGSQPQVNLDMAKHNIDLLNLLEQKTVNNLSDEEKRMLDAALYETRMRYVSVASQYT